MQEKFHGLLLALFGGHGQGYAGVHHSSPDQHTHDIHMPFLGGQSESVSTAARTAAT